MQTCESCMRATNYKLCKYCHITQIYLAKGKLRQCMMFIPMQVLDSCNSLFGFSYKFLPFVVVLFFPATKDHSNDGARDTTNKRRFLPSLAEKKQSRPLDICTFQRSTFLWKIILCHLLDISKHSCHPSKALSKSTFSSFLLHLIIIVCYTLPQTIYKCTHDRSAEQQCWSSNKTSQGQAVSYTSLSPTLFISHSRSTYIPNFRLHSSCRAWQLASKQTNNLYTPEQQTFSVTTASSSP